MVKIIRRFFSSIRALLKLRPRSSTRIFAFNDGLIWRSIDPLTVIHALEVHPTFLAEKHLKPASEGNREALEIVAGAVSEVFGVSPYQDGKGLTISERYQLLCTFYIYCHAVKKNINPG